MDPPEKKISVGDHYSYDCASYRNLDAKEVDPPMPPPQPLHGATLMPSQTFIDIGALAQSAPSLYVTAAPTRSASMKIAMEKMRNTLGRWSLIVRETTKAAEDLSRNVWQHLNIGSSITEAAMGWIAQSTKVIAEGGYDKIFRQTFENFPEEQLKQSFVCYLSTSAGPVMGTMYISTAKVAFCSDNPLSYKAGNQTEWSYYKVVIPLHQLRAAKPSSNQTNSAEKYIQIVSVDNHEFWFMGFLSYENALRSLEEAVQDLQA
ncbi:hypothetical protein HPP92_007125 [Vanilla planifolia]|uniref:GRAM domain-containing protein n=1 Tax=Vanilla planifolia TaxID=51239 RepID=A0A835RQS1_VANPL|nr:hypothetical protein HPP92_007363 [Vanilla planifolia]KAG0490262.1 hypothetical protein HPP92_007125 [Vanilla planifolia]